MNWLEMPELVGVLLTDSFVLGWDTIGQEISIKLDYALSQDHPEYSVPKSGEWACFKVGALRFVGVTSVIGLPRQESVRFNIDSTGDKDYGEIETLDLNGHVYVIGLEFGQVTIHADSIAFVLTEHKNSLR